jgi:hypothetical protein
MRARRIWLLTVLALCGAVSCAAAQDAATWSFAVDEAATVPKSVATPKGKIVVDLSALPKEAEVFRAGLVCVRRDYRPYRFPNDKLVVVPADRPEEPLTLRPPAYKVLDATEPVARAVGGGKKAVTFLFKSGRHWQADKTRLTVSFTGGTARRDLPRPAGLAARHRDGQTLLTWADVDPPTKTDAITIREWRELRKALAKKPAVRYHVYRSDRPLSSATVAEAELVRRVGRLSCWNRPYYGVHGRYDKALDVKLFRYVVDEGKGPVPPGTAIAAYNPPPVYENPDAPEAERKEKAQRAYYGVTAAVNGEEDFSKIAAVGPVEETSGDGPFVLQRTLTDQTFQYVKKVTLRYYVRWEGPPRCNRPGVPYDYLVAEPPNLKKPAPVQVSLHCWGGSLNGGYGGWHGGRSGALALSTNQIPYDWWVSYHEYLHTQKCWADGLCRDFTVKRVLGFLDWVKTRWAVDETRVFVKGGSMGGSGASMIAVRYPGRFAFGVSSVGVHNAADSNGFRGSYERSVGLVKHALKHESGLNVWDYLSNSHLLRKDPGRDMPFLCFGNGKDDHGIGWEQALDFARACQETRQPHTFGWNLGGHTARLYWPGMDIRLDQTLPAFSRCSLDDDPGTATKRPEPKVIQDGKWTRKDLFDGVSYGQLNAYLRWDAADVVDEKDAWAMTVYLSKGDRRGRGKAPKDTCTVDVTPRRCRAFRPKPGDAFTWRNTAAGTGKVVQSGTVKADRWGLVTLKEVTVTKAKNRLRIFTGDE